MTHETWRSSWSLEEARSALQLSTEELWIRCLAIGADFSLARFNRLVKMDPPPGDLEHNYIAQALNDEFLERGLSHPVPYRGGVLN